MGKTVKKMAVGGLLGGGMGAQLGGLSGGIGKLFSGGPSTVATSSSSQPGKYALPAYQQMVGNAMKYNADPNSMSGALNADQAQGLGMIRNLATNGNGLLGAAGRTMEDTVSGKYLDPNTNPFLQGSIDKALGSVRGSLGSTFAGQNFGSSAHEQMMNRESMNAAMPYLMQNYQNERGLQMNATGQAQPFAYGNANQLLGAGNMQQQIAGQQQGLLGQAIGLGGQDTVGVQPNPNKGSTLGNVLGTAATIGGLYSM